MRAKICYSYSMLVLKINIESCKVSMEKKSLQRMSQNLSETRSICKQRNHFNHWKIA